MAKSKVRTDDDFIVGKFPENFIWSVATAAHQIEGETRNHGKGESIWNEFEKHRGNIADGSNADVACDSYNKYKEDIRIIKELGLSYYRFSISWPRILPNGNSSFVNMKGIDYYNALINKLLKENINPIVTLYHWDLPIALQNSGGWANENIIKHFENYSRICYTNFGDRVKYWITINEPICICWLGHGLGTHAPGIKEPMTTAFLTAHNIILSHVKAYKLYDIEFRPTQKGKVGITLNSEWGEPTNWLDIDDLEASERFMLFKLGWFADPIYRTGDYPDIIKAQFNKLSTIYGCPPLPSFTKEQIKENRGTSDFFGLNHYTSRLVKKLNNSSNDATPEQLLTGIHESVDESWRLAGSSWLYEAPIGLRHLLNWVKYRYSNPQIFITENGTSDNIGEIKDLFRINYHRNYINQVLKAINEDKVNVIGYTVWSLLDNFEWEQGFLERFGLYFVDFSDPNLVRKPKDSALFYAKVVKNNGFDVSDI